MAKIYLTFYMEFLKSYIFGGNGLQQNTTPEDKETTSIEDEETWEYEVEMIIEEHDID